MWHSSCDIGVSCMVNKVNCCRMEGGAYAPASLLYVNHVIYLKHGWGGERGRGMMGGRKIDIEYIFACIANG